MEKVTPDVLFSNYIAPRRMEAEKARGVFLATKFVNAYLENEGGGGSF
jgi:hypothetical protein